MRLCWLGCAQNIDVVLTVWFSVGARQSFLTDHASFIPSAYATTTTDILVLCISSAVLCPCRPVVDGVSSRQNHSRLLSHYLFWVMLLPFALAHKDRDDGWLLEADNRLSLRKRQHKVWLSTQRVLSTFIDQMVTQSPISCPKLRMKPQVSVAHTDLCLPDRIISNTEGVLQHGKVFRRRPVPTPNPPVRNA